MAVAGSAEGANIQGCSAREAVLQAGGSESRLGVEENVVNALRCGVMRGGASDALLRARVAAEQNSDPLRRVVGQFEIGSSSAHMLSDSMQESIVEPPATPTRFSTIRQTLSFASSNS